MNNKQRFITAVLTAEAAAAAIASAPTAFAADTRTCGGGGGATICQSPGNVEIHTEPPRVQAPMTYGPYSNPIPFLLN